MRNFEEQYCKYLADNKERIKGTIERAEDEFNMEFERHMQGEQLGLRSVAPVFLSFLIVFGISCSKGQILLEIVSIVLMAALSIYCVFLNGRIRDSVARYFFRKYMCDEVIDGIVRKDEQMAIETLLEDINNKYIKYSDDPEIFKDLCDTDYQEIKCFYCECSDRLKKDYAIYGKHLGDK